MQETKKGLNLNLQTPTNVQERHNDIQNIQPIMDR
jgi:hypothetical protein